MYKPEVKKHVSQMTISEKFFLITKLKEVEEWEGCGHFKEALQEREGDLAKAIEVLTNGHIIEYRQKRGISRVTVRGNLVHNQQNACVVFELFSSDIITFYWNNVEDNHPTLNLNGYDANLNIIQMVREEKQALNEKEHMEKMYKIHLIQDFYQAFEENLQQYEKHEDYTKELATDITALFDTNLANERFKDEFVTDFAAAFVVNLENDLFKEEFIADFNNSFSANLKKYEYTPNEANPSGI